MIPIVQRFLRIAGGGVSERAREAAVPISREEARMRLDLQKEARKAIKEKKSIDEFANADPRADADMVDKRKSAFKSQHIRFQSDPLILPLTRAGSNDQRVAMVLSRRGDFKTDKEFARYVFELRDEKFISDEVEAGVLEQLAIEKR
jgi:hypothetical protein